MTRAGWVGVALVISLGANLYLLATRREDATSTPATSAVPTAAAATPVSGRAALPTAAPRPRAPDAPGDPRFARLDRRALEARLAKVEAKLDELLPLPERFELEAPSPESEARVRAILDDVIIPDGASRGYEVACRGRICKVDVTTTKQTDEEWTRALQTDGRHHGAFSRMMFGASGTHVELQEPALAAAFQWAFTLTEQVHADPRIAACKQSHPAPGLVLLMLHFDTASSRVIVNPALGNPPSGACMQSVVEDLLARTRVPEAIPSLSDWPIQINVP